MIGLKKTIRMQHGIVSFTLIGVFLLLWLFFYKVYPLIAKTTTIFKLPHIEENIFLFPAGLILIGLIVTWGLRNQLWRGPVFAIHHYHLIKRLRRQIKDARFEDEREFDNRLVRLPRINIHFDDYRKRTTGRILIRNSINFDKRLENMRIDSALKRYVTERQYLSQDRNWYVYEFYKMGSKPQNNIESKSGLLEWMNETSDDFQLRLDERSTVSLNHVGLVGQTGSGKSILIQMLVEQILLKKVSHELFIIDPKRTDVYQMGRNKLGNDKVADKSNAIALIKSFHSRMQTRHEELQDFFSKNPNKTYEDAGFPALILLIDEFGALRESWKTLPKKERDEVDTVLSDVSFMGRQLGCFLWIATQQMNAQTIPTDIREQLVLKIALGDSDEQTYRTLFASGVDIPPVQFGPGQGIFSFPNLASVDKPRLLMIPYCRFLIDDP